MIPKITNEMRQALHEQKGKPVRVEDDETASTYYLLSANEYQHIAQYLENRDTREAELRRELQIGFDEADRGDVASWDAEAIKAKGRSILEQKSQAS